MTNTELEQRIISLEKKYSEIEQKIALKTSEIKYSVKQVADLLDLTECGVRYHIRQGNIIPLPGKKRFQLISETELNRYVNTLTKKQANA